MKPVDVKAKHVLTFVKKIILKNLDLKLVIKWEYENVKSFSQNVAFQSDT